MVVRRFAADAPLVHRTFATLLTSLALLNGCGGEPNKGTGGTGATGGNNVGGAGAGGGNQGGAGGSETGGGGAGGGMAIEIEKPDNAIPGQYMFILNDQVVTPANVQATADELLKPQKGTLLKVFDGAFMGFSANGLDDTKALAMAKDPRVQGISQDFTVTLSGVESNAPWGLDRIDSRPKAFDSQFTYLYSGQGVHAYVVDSGIRATHQDFGGRVLAHDGVDLVGDGKGTDDCHGHGTHVAAILGGTTFGVAKKVTLHPVRVADCNASASGSSIIAGIDWIAKNQKTPAVVNMSMNGPVSTFVNAALAKLTAKNIPIVVSAGNDNADACKNSPGNYADAITVAAIDKTDSLPSFTNFGKCVDIVAPGVSILSATNADDVGVIIKSGTSQAAPHVTGVVAMMLGANPSMTVNDVTTTLLNGATPNLVADPFSPKKSVVYSRFFDPTIGFLVPTQWQVNINPAGGILQQPQSYYTIQYPDLNGDGKKDVCVRVDSQGISCALSTGTQFGPLVLAAPAFSDPAVPNDSYWGTIQYGDINGDGKDDICGRRGDGFFCGTSDGTGKFQNLTSWSSSFVDGAGWETNQKYWGSIKLVDVNGDGKKDVCGRSSAGVVCGLSTGTAFGMVQLWSAAYGDGGGFDALASYWGTLQYPDINGDGKADVCARASAGIFCAVSNGTQFSAVSYWDDYYTDAGPWDDDPKYWVTIQFPDINGDKHVDVCGVADGGLTCKLAP